MPVHNYCSASLLPRLILFSIPFLTFLTWCSYIKKNICQNLQPKCSREFLLPRGLTVAHVNSHTYAKKERRRMGLEGGKSLPHLFKPTSSVVWRPGSRKALIYIEPIQCFCFSRGYYVNVFLNQIQYSICYTSFLYYYLLLLLFFFISFCA